MGPFLPDVVGFASLFVFCLEGWFLVTSSFSAPADLSPAGPKRQQRGIQLPQLLLSLLVVAVFALLAVWWQASTTSRDPVLALARDVERGEPITQADLTEIYISTDVPTRTSSVDGASAFLGTLPVADLQAGTLLTPDLVRRGRPLLTGQAFVGLSLDESRAPTGLSPDDRVQVLAKLSDGGVDILSQDAMVESARYDGSQVRLRLRLDVESAQAVQLNANSVVVIEVDNSGAAVWEIDESDNTGGSGQTVEISDDEEDPS